MSWVDCGGKLWAPKCKEVTHVLRYRDEDVLGVVCSARNGVVFSSAALHCPCDWKGERWSRVLYNGGSITKASEGD